MNDQPRKILNQENPEMKPNAMLFPLLQMKVSLYLIQEKHSHPRKVLFDLVSPRITLLRSTGIDDQEGVLVMYLDG